MRGPRRLRTWWALLADVGVVSLALLGAWGIRATFQNFFFDFDRLLFILPYFIFVRLLVNLAFEDYSLSFKNFHPADIQRILAHNAIPTALFLVLRYFVRYPRVRIPTSIILAEYVLTFAGMIIVRLLILTPGSGISRQATFVRKRRAYIYGDIRRIASDIPPALEAEPDVRVEGIFTSDRLSWNTDFQGTRVLGGLDRLRRSLSLNDGIGTLLVGGLARREEAEELWRMALSYGVSLRWIDPEGAQPVSSWMGLLDRLFHDVSIPAELAGVFRGKRLAVVGGESRLFAHLLRMCAQHGLGPLDSYPVLARGEVARGHDLVLDLRYALLRESGLEAGELPAELGDDAVGGSRVVALPGYGPDRARGLLGSDLRARFLFTEGYYSARGRRPPMEQAGWLEAPAAVAAAILKVAAQAEADRRLYYFRSTDAVRLGPYRELLPGRQAGSQEEFLEAAARIGLEFEETEHFQLYRLKEGRG
jgi:hypothetical protein